MNESGKDNEGKEYAAPSQLWQEALQQPGGIDSWYNKAVDYWDHQEASYNGVLGGFGYVSDIDIRDSRQLLLKAMKNQFEEARTGPRQLVTLDCGAGVGRISEQLLLHHFHEVDLLEPSRHLLDTAEKNMVKNRKAKFPPDHRVVNLYCSGLQQHNFVPQRYDCIWIQWCLLYLTDVDVIRLLDEQCRLGLKPDGVIMVKENICRQGFVVDQADSSLTRSNAYMLELLEKANMELLYNVKQKNFPKELFEVRMYIVRPKPRPQ